MPIITLNEAVADDMDEEAKAEGSCLIPARLQIQGADTEGKVGHAGAKGKAKGITVGSSRSIAIG